MKHFIIFAAPLVAMVIPASDARAEWGSQATSHGMGWKNARAMNFMPWLHMNGPLFNYGPYLPQPGYNPMFVYNPVCGQYIPAYPAPYYAQKIGYPYDITPHIPSYNAYMYPGEYNPFHGSQGPYANTSYQNLWYNQGRYTPYPSAFGYTPNPNYAQGYSNPDNYSGSPTAPLAGTYGPGQPNGQPQPANLGGGSVQPRPGAATPVSRPANGAAPAAPATQGSLAFPTNPALRSPRDFFMQSSRKTPSWITLAGGSAAEYLSPVIPAEFSR